MLKLSYDLHIHSCLSPCGDEDMTPGNIIGMSMVKELDVIAVTDHNSCKNCPAIISLAEKNNIIAIPGMELCTMEEVHVLCLFVDLKDAMNFDQYVSQQLIKIPNDERIFGKQQIVDENDYLVGEEPYLLINATNISFDYIGTLMKKYNGVAIPSHMDKPTNSILSNLGFIPPDVSFTCFELSNRDNLSEICQKHPYLKGCNVITNSDAHSLGAIQEPINFIKVKSKSKKDILNSLSRDNTN